MATSLLASTTVAIPAAAPLRDLKKAVKSSTPRVLSCQQRKNLSVRAISEDKETTGRRDVVKMAGALFTLGLFGSAGNANAGLTEDLLAKSAANKELNDKKRLATSGANTARAYTVENGSCSFPYNFTGCEDLAKTKDVKFLTEDLKLECQGRDAYKCAENSFWKGKDPTKAPPLARPSTPKVAK